VRVAHPANLGTVTDLLAPLGTESPRIDQPGRRVAVPVLDGTHRLADAVRSISDHGIELDDIGLRRPTLDEVFLALTGASS